MNKYRFECRCGLIIETHLGGQFRNCPDCSANLSEPSMLNEDQVLYMAGEILRDILVKGDAFTDPATTRKFLMVKLRKQEREVFACLFLDNQHRLIDYEELFQGTVDGASVHPREVVKAALRHNAAAVIFAHNHPSGISDPSEADKRITTRLKDALALVDVRVLDHLIVGESVTSMAELGLL